MNAKSYTAPKPSKAQVRLIEALGDNHKVAQMVSEKMNLAKPLVRQAVGQWKVRGIPHAYRPVLIAEANRQGVAVPDEFQGMQGAA